jgi:hypothetical protein
MYWFYLAVGLYVLSTGCLWTAFYRSKVNLFAWIGSFFSTGAMGSLFYFIWLLQAYDDWIVQNTVAGDQQLMQIIMTLVQQLSQRGGII